VIREGVWVDEDGVLHCDVHRLLQALNIRPTMANQLWLQGILERAAREANPEVEILEAEVTVE
jgi:hypothetical protein